MEVIVTALKEQKPYDELKDMLINWDGDGKTHIFLDLAIVHKCKEGVRLIGDMEGPNIYMTPYDLYDRVTPIYISQLLSSLHEDYNDILNYMIVRIEDSKPWNRRKYYLFIMKFSKFWSSKLPKGIIRMIGEEYL
ncbi:unnamed protein product [Blepharisma stoltei]|uniref:Uncharacterized protein n=1 Tax=Blepharisma stoltei TaxID=1481888 RepID=A0AAU9IT80_9CILI|nr:unnamed protein product [Blepharisma stoltei]